MEYDHERGMSRESPDLFEEEEEFSNPLYSDEDSREEWATLRVDPSTTSAPKTEAIPLNGSRTDAESSKQATGSEKVAPKPGSPDPSPPMTRIGLNDNKAGMEGLDKAKINQIILEASRGSKFYENEVKKEKQVTKRINRMLEELKKITPAQKVAALSVVDRELESLEEGRDLAHIVVHVDMDAFYAAVEMRDDPRLKDVPMAVGGSAMLSTSNYHARRYGVRAAMPGFIAKRLCPELVIVPLNFSKYREASRQVREILMHYDPHFSPVGLDESYLDLTDYVHRQLPWCQGAGPVMPSRPRDTTLELDTRECQECQEFQECVMETLAPCPSTTPVATTEDVHPIPPTPDRREDTQTAAELVVGLQETRAGRTASEALSYPAVQDDTDHVGGRALSMAHWRCAERAVEEMRKEIVRRTGLTASAGLAPNMMLAKVASDMNKPNGQYMVTPTREGVLEFVQKLPIRKISGIGKVTERMLNALGVTTCGDLYRQRATLHLLFSKTSSSHFLRVCMGLGSTAVHREYDRKSMSTERTFAEISSPAELQQKCHELCQDLAEDMQKDSIKGHTVTLKLKTVLFKVKTRAVTLPRPVAKTEELYLAARDLLAAEVRACAPSPLRLRLMGVRISSLLSKDKGGKQETLDTFIHHPPPTSTASCSVEQESSHTPAPQVCTHMVQCPVCGQVLAESADNTAVNRHIDECLNRPAIGIMMESPTKTACVAAEMSSRPGGKRGGKKEQRAMGGGPRKRKSKSGTFEEDSKKRKTLDQFWKHS